VFHSQIGKEHNEFDFNDVVNTVCKKLVYRHPHIFSDVVAKTSEEVLENWDKLKAKEKHMVSFTDTLKAVPVALPACVRAQKVQKRAAKAGYDFENINMAIEKLEEELSELKEALYLKDVDAANEEIGDLLFSTINLSRFLKADSEELLTASVNKFINRFEKAECLAVQEKTTLDKLDAEKLDTLWIKAKLSEK
jgi:tetrapyrrole methylase family protein/MazG family protein